MSKKTVIPMKLSGAITSFPWISREFPEFGNYHDAVFYLSVSAGAPGAGTFTVVIQEQDPVSLVWTDGAGADPAAVLSFTAVTMSGTLPNTQRVALSPVPGIRYRAVGTAGGGLTSVTFSLSALVTTEE